MCQLDPNSVSQYQLIYFFFPKTGEFAAIAVLLGLSVTVAGGMTSQVSQYSVPSSAVHLVAPSTPFIKSLPGCTITSTDSRLRVWAYGTMVGLRYF